MQLQLSKNDSNVLKGIALMMLLCHHLFYYKDGPYDDIYVYKDYGLTWMLAMACKACVPLFVFLSGYGLAASIEKWDKVDWKKFFIHRFSKLYLNYWLIWLIFVPIGIFFYDRTFESVYGNHREIKLILDWFGLINCLGIYGYNATWWFYSCIIVLYLLFPLISKVKYNEDVFHFWLLGSLILCFIPCGPLTPIKFYLITFILGIYMRNGLNNNILPPPIMKICNSIIEGKLNIIEIIILTILVFVYIPLRVKLPYNLLLDTFFAIGIIAIYKNIRLHAKVLKSLSFLGKQSMNIFLFHTFLYAIYFEELIYWNPNPFLILISLTFSCILISLGIEKIKTIFNVNELLKLGI